jgi:hypothetical protein
MMRRVCAMLRHSVFLLITAAASVAAQGAVTVTGHVSASAMPLRGATVRIAELDLGSTTDADGRFSFIIPSARVLGQTVALVASHPRFPSKAISLVLIGGAIDRDFDLTPLSGATRVDRPRPTETSTAAAILPDTNSATARTTSLFPLTPSPWIGAPLVEGSALSDLAGPISVGAALAGRMAALDVRSASTLGGTSSLLVRGPRTIAGLTEPLVVVNGMVFENSNISTLAQRSGQGGFDYGTTLNDLNVEDIATVQLLTGSLAAMQFGGRAANGVLLITTHSARGLHAFEISASQSYSNGSVLRLPDYQNAYGQGLGGKFAFFDGKGGGINDTTSQSWGPALDGAIVLQASLKEAGRADARAWLPAPDNIASYFNSGRTLGTHVALQRGGDRGQFRASFSNRSSKGVTPESGVAYRSALITGSALPTDRLSVQADLQAYSDRGHDRAGTGFDESNPVAGLTLLPRQVAVPLYRVLLRDAAGAQLSWNYSGRNNPFWASLVNDNTDSRARYVLGGTASYALANQLTASIRASSDMGSQDRRFDVAKGWMGGFPYALGRGDFSRGGYESDAITTAVRDVEASLRFAPQPAGVFKAAYTFGVGHHGDRLESATQATDNLTDTVAVKNLLWDASSSTNVLFARIESRINDRASIAVGARSESSTLMSGASVSTVYPSATANVDLVRADGGLLDLLTLQAGFSRSGSEGTALLLQRLGVSTATSAAMIAEASAPEITTGFDGGVSMRMLGGMLSVDLAAYSERSENLIVPSGSGFARAAAVTNKGVEATASLAPLHGLRGMTWSIGGTFGKNSNRVEAISGTGTNTVLGLPFGTATIEAREGSPLGAIVGTSFLRNADGALILRSGVPLADSVTGRHVVGQSGPSWIGGLATSVRMGGVELGVQFDTRRGGQLFSASNRAGAYSGALSETAFRPDTGLLIAGVDAATGAVNAIHATTEAYYHALGAVTERWVYDASFVKLRDAHATFTLPLQFINLLRVQSVRASVIGRNLALWTSAPNIDPETVLSASTFRGAEMGQLPTVRSVGFQVSLTP